MKPRKLAKRLKRLERRVADLEAARWQPAHIESEEVDAQMLLRDAVVDWMHYWEDDDGDEWCRSGYL